MTVFTSTLHGIPCQVQVIGYSRGYPATYEQPAEPPEFDYRILDRRGYKAPWLEKYLSAESEYRILDEYIKHAADYHCGDRHDY